MKKKEADKGKTKEKPQFKYRHIYVGTLLTLISLILFLSIVQGERVLYEDFDRLQSERISFVRFISLNFPAVDNIIGPFGAFFGHVIYLVFGLYFSNSLLLALFILGLLQLICPTRKDYEAKVFFFILFAFLFNVFLVSVSPNFLLKSGFLVNALHNVLFRVFSSTGTAIISLTVSLGLFLAIIETNTVKFILRKLLNLFKYLYDSIRSRKEEVDEDIPQRPRTKRKDFDTAEEEDDDEIIDNKTIIPPQITNHKDKNVSVTDKDFGFGIEGEEDIEDDEGLDLPRPEINGTKVAAKASTKKFDDETIPDKYQKPSIEMFLQSPPLQPFKNREEIEENINNLSRILIEKLARLGIEAEVVNVNVGPVITQFELKPAPNVKVSKFSNVASDLALAIKAKSIRVQAPIPGKGLVGVEIPNREREIIFLKEVLDSEEMNKSQGKLTIAMGKDIVGNPVVADLAKMPHLLIAGSTGSGKSVCVNSIICNLLFRTEPEELRLVMIDPKRIELSGYEGIPHLIQNIVSDTEEALTVINWAVNEMEKRYELLQRFNVRDINSYNKKAKSRKSSEEEMEYLPYIIIVIDEFADLILKSGRDVEMPITRLAQMARAIGIHLIIATQRPSMKIITGLIKANFPAKIAFRVAQKVDSRVILDMNGAESLLGSGDMLMITPTKALPERIHGTFVSDEEIENLVEYLRTQPKPEQKIEIVTDMQDDVELLDFDDELFIEAAKIVIATGSASVSMLQRTFKIGYARAGRLIDMLEQAKIIGKYAGSKSRDIIATEEIKDAYNLKY